MEQGADLFIQKKILKYTADRIIQIARELILK